MLGSEQRKNRRYPSIACARVPDAFSGDALLKDLSVTGCCIECTMHIDIDLGSVHRITIYPEENSKIGNFTLTVECKWIRSGSYSCGIGFGIKESPRGKTFQRYVDYLSWRSSAV
ncbi:MAG: PilZ domain-containing protein [Treponema sp.]|jgi:hypothetical protein|nr:PilZ domain-containing protein [Treponema sp.]